MGPPGRGSEACSLLPRGPAVPCAGLPAPLPAGLAVASRSGGAACPRSAGSGFAELGTEPRAGSRALSHTACLCAGLHGALRGFPSQRALLWALGREVWRPWRDVSGAGGVRCGDGGGQRCPCPGVPPSCQAEPCPEPPASDARGRDGGARAERWWPEHVCCSSSVGTAAPPGVLRWWKSCCPWPLALIPA